MKNAPRVLIIEDNEISRRALRAILHYEEMEVVGEARDGEAGLEMFARFRPDLVCLDVMLPGMDGMEVLAEIRSQAPNVPVLMITGHNEREAIKRMIDGGAAGIVLKPFNGARVIEAVKRCLDQVSTKKPGKPTNR